MNKKIFVALSTFAEYGKEPLELLEKSGLPFSLNTLGRRLKAEEIVSLGGDCHGVIAGVEPYNASVLNQMPNLKCISRCGVGMDNIDHAVAQQRGIILRNTPDAVAQPVAELALGFTLDLLRHISWHTAQVKGKVWQKKGGKLLSGAQIGILGLGRIGRRVAEMMTALGAQVSGTDLRLDENWAKKYGVKMVSLETLLKNSDVLLLHLSVDVQTPFLLGTKELAMMKPGAALANLSRGELLDEAALYQALKSRDLSAAALDVFSVEPYAGPLCELDNVIMTPHIATLTEESRLQMEIEATQNVIGCIQNL